MQEKIDLKVDFCSFQASKYAVENWHYTGTMPAGKTFKIGVWENNKFIGAIIYSRGATLQIGLPFNLEQNFVCELTRVALREHKTPVSKMLSISFVLLKKHNPNLKLIISYADAMQNHKGGIYQATNWVYLGKTKKENSFVVNGKNRHKRSLYSLYGRGRQNIKWLRENVDPNAQEIWDNGKHKYIYPLNKKVRKKIMPYAKKYPEHFEDGEEIEKNFKVDLSKC